MQIRSFKKVIVGTALGLTLVLGGGAVLSNTAFADDRDDHRRDRDEQRDRERDRGRGREWRERRAREQREQVERERLERERAWEWRQRGRDRYYQGPYYGRSGIGGLTSYGRSVAEQRGFATGLDRGRDDGHGGRSFNPNNSDHYRDGDSGYSSSFGSKEAYRQVYRSSFMRGYDQGYRETGRGRWRR